MSSATIGADGTLYVGSYDKKLYAIGGPTEQAVTPGTATDKTIYVYIGVSFLWPGYGCRCILARHTVHEDEARSKGATGEGKG